MPFSFNFIKLTTCHSTNELISEKRKINDVWHGDFYLTDEQTAGKGQRGNVWEAEPFKNITGSFLLEHPDFSIENQFRLTQLISLSIQHTLSKYLKNVKIKWPNDIYVGDKKIAGILIENFIKGNSIYQSIVGIGLNVNQEQFMFERATSIYIESGEFLEINQILKDLESSFNLYWPLFVNQEWGILHHLYLSHLFRYKIKSKFENQGVFEGTIIGVDDLGQLEVEISNEIKKFDLKEIKFLF